MLSLSSSLLRNHASSFVRASLRNASRNMSSVINLSDGSAINKFEDIKKKRILYFTAVWCPPCKMIKPVYTKLAKEYPEIAFGKVDIDEAQDAAMDFEISSVPTFIFFNDKDTIGRFSGADENQLENLIKNLEDA
eukprot:CAMPEP_0194114180 /NCGR_PEP_ID=MMETSP0150-20130528/19206_1 /TAXON_ID=122233 /ORGANISM="Chaetoceros debilis, Strain MM31A-1" /LENGTH=134 /DNA_ID=CAMNT_0038804305 /DNA_START=99 /DNA_END=503 /DNA_ORIENTATION=+